MYLSLSILLSNSLCNRYSIDKRKFHQILALFVTFFVYTLYRAVRRPLAIVKPKLFNKECFNNKLDEYYGNNSESCGWPTFEHSNGVLLLGWLDTANLVAFAVFVFVSGYVAERCDLRYFLTICLTLCGILCILFGIAYPLKIQSYYYFIVIQVLSGALQSTGLPAVVTIVGNWLGQSNNGLIFGIWSWHFGFGNILGAVLAGAFVDYNWGLSFIVPGVTCVAMGVIVFLFLIPGPKDIRLSSKGKAERKTVCFDLGEKAYSPISFYDALEIKGVIEYSICLFFVKMVGFTFLNWLPEYNNHTKDVSPSLSAYLSIAFDFGGMVGSVLSGFISDKTETKAITCMIFITLAIPSTYFCYQWSSVSLICDQFLQFIAGIFVNGPYSFITTTVSADLGKRVKTKNALATVTAIIQGSGSIGAVIGPFLAGYLQNYGWKAVFYMIIIAETLALIPLIRSGINEFRQLYSQRKSKQNEEMISNC